MKKIFFFLLATLFATSFLTSCGKSGTDPGDDPGDDPPTEVGPLSKIDSITFTSAKDASLIYIDTKLTWTASIDGSWISTTSETKDGKTGILIGATVNTGLPRQGYVTLSAGTQKHKIKIKQAGAPYMDFTVGNVSFRMILVKAGKFNMGDNLNNAPAHEIKVDSFYICETEVTNALWTAVKGSLPYDLNGNTNQPVSNVTYSNIVDEFFPNLKTKLTYTFRLPTEAEWEFAALGGEKSNGFTYSGSNVLSEVGWFSNNASTKQDVKQKTPNELGIYDMSGNVSEWCSDWYAPYTGISEKNPKGPATGELRVIRGGNYVSSILFGYSFCNVKARYYLNPVQKDGVTGFRFVISL